MKIYKLSSISELLKVLKPEEPVYLDTETSKLGSDIRLIQVYQEAWKQVLLFDTCLINPQIVWDIIQPYTLIGHNITYDFGCFRKDIKDFKMPEHWEDTFYLSRLVWPELNTGNGFTLDSCLTEAIGYDPYKMEGLNKKQYQMSFERLKIKDKYIEGDEGLKDLTPKQYLYASIDVYELPNLWHKVKHERDNFVYQLDIKTIEHIQTDTKGLPLDLKKLQTIVEKDISLVAEIQKKLPINVNSYMQVRKVLGTVLSSNEEALSIIQHRPQGLTGLAIRTKQPWSKALKEGIQNNTIRVEIREFGKAKPITSVEQLPTSNKVLVYYYETSYQHSTGKIETAKLILEERKALKRLNFADRAKKAYIVDENNIPRIRGTFSPHAINGRIQVDNENLSQYPRTMKSMWGHTPGNGRKLVYSDFAQVELRIICAALPEMNMYKSLKEGVDLHTFVGNNLNLSDEDLSHLPDGISPRFIAKQCNFLLLYGGGNSNFQRTVCKLGGVWFNEEITQKITSKWKDIFSDIKAWHLKNGKSQTKMDKTVSGRPYKAGTITDLNNIKVSGTGSEIFKLWLHYIDKYILTQYSDIYIVNRVHDSVLIDVPDNSDLYKEIAHKLALTAQKAWFEIIKAAPLKDVPMPVDVAVGSNWEDIEHEKNLDYSLVLDNMYMYDKSLEEELCKVK